MRVFRIIGSIFVAGASIINSNNIQPRIKPYGLDVEQHPLSDDSLSANYCSANVARGQLSIENIGAPNDEQKGDGQESHMPSAEYTLDSNASSERDVDIAIVLKEEDIALIKQIAINRPNLLKERDSSGRNAMTLATSQGRTEVIKAIGEINPELLKEQDDSGRNVMTLATSQGRTEVIKAIGEVAPELLKERDRSGWNAMTRAAYEGKIEVVKEILKINPELLKEQDQSGSNAMTMAAKNRKHPSYKKSNW